MYGRAQVGAQLALRFPLPPLPAELEGQRKADADALEGLLGRLTWHTDTDKYNDRKTFDFGPPGVDMCTQRSS